jgi:hypothetical protein
MKELPKRVEKLGHNVTDESFIVPDGMSIEDRDRHLIVLQNLQNLDDYIKFCDDEDNYDDAMQAVDEFMRDKL